MAAPHSAKPLEGSALPSGGEGKVPRHLAIIMDGNGRWAISRSLPRVAGHKAGVDAVRRLVRIVAGRGIEILTLFAFSTENWSRPEAEISELMRLLRYFIRSDLAELHANNIRIRIIGDRINLSPDLAGLLDEAEGTTAANTGMTLVVAFNYGGRQEIARATRKLALEVAAGRLDPAMIDADLIDRNLDTAGWPEPDLIIRTSGEKRISNFLLWQAAYSEFVFSPVLWPDFDERALEEALGEFSQRKRRFGGL